MISRGGGVGVMYQSDFLAPVWWSCPRSMILDYLAHLTKSGWCAPVRIAHAWVHGHSVHGPRLHLVLTEAWRLWRCLASHSQPA